MISAPRSRRAKIYCLFSYNNIAAFFDNLFDTLC
jgi:hypothetical protein